MAVLVLVEHDAGELAEPSAQALTLARGLASEVAAVAVGRTVAVRTRIDA